MNYEYRRFPLASRGLTICEPSTLFSHRPATLLASLIDQARPVNSEPLPPSSPAQYRYRYLSSVTSIQKASTPRGFFSHLNPEPPRIRLTALSSALAITTLPFAPLTCWITRNWAQSNRGAGLKYLCVRISGV